MNLEEIFALPGQNDIVNNLKKRSTPLPDVLKLKNEYSPKGHKIYDRSERPDKEVKDNRGNLQRFEKVARVSLPLQRLIVDRAVAFLFGNPVKMHASLNTDAQYTVFEAVRRTLVENKIDSHNRKIARILMSETEVAEYWYPVESPSFWKKLAQRPRSILKEEVPSKYKLKVAIFSPALGDRLYPLFDQYGDMIAFSRQYQIDKDKGQENFFETFTDGMIYRWRSSDQVNWELAEARKNILGKIPIVYARQPKSEWEDVQHLIDRLEKLLSNFADTNDYHSAPKIFVTGEIRGFARKGETGAIIEGEPNATASYLAWQQAPESVRLEIDTLLKMIYSATQTPDISFESVKGIGGVSGVALKMLFLDAHLKVNNKEEIFNDYLERRVNIILKYLGELNVLLKPYIDDVEISQQIVPFMINDSQANISSLLSASGGKAILSQKTAVALSGMVKDADAEYEQLVEENQEAIQAQNAYSSLI